MAGPFKEKPNQQRKAEHPKGRAVMGNEIPSERKVRIPAIPSCLHPVSFVAIAKFLGAV